MASIWFGLVVHFKIYPIIYALPIYFFIGNYFFNKIMKKENFSQKKEFNFL